MPRKIIGLFGPAGCGKTTLARQMIGLGYSRLPFAAPIKSMLADFLKTQGVPYETIERMLNGDLKEEPSEFFCGRSTRYAMQTLGTEWRELIDTNLWVNAWTNIVNSPNTINFNIVADDIRYPHEVACVREVGGRIIQIIRPDFRRISSSNHSSETSFGELVPDFILVNDGAPGQLLAKFQSLKLEK